MFRELLTVIGVVEVLTPDALIDAAERLALDNPDECELRPWVTPGARLEGLVFVALTWRSERSYATFKRFLGVIGLLALLFPRAYLAIGSDLAYTEDSTPSWKPWVYPGTRLIGLCYLLVALGELTNR